MRPRPHVTTMPNESEVIVINKIRFRHYSEFPMDQWRWKNFSPQEMASRREGELMITEAAMDKLQALRELVGPMIVNSAYRSAAHNKAVGGAKDSFHMKGEAFDVRMDNHDPAEFEAAARKVGFTGFGYYPKNGFMHIDIGPARTWGTKFPPRNKTTATPSFPMEKPLVPETPKKDSVLGAVGVIAASGAVQQIGDAMGALDRYAQYGLVAIAAVAIAWIAYKRLR